MDFFKLAKTTVFIYLNYIFLNSHVRILQSCRMFINQKINRENDEDRCAETFAFHVRDVLSFAHRQVCESSYFVKVCVCAPCDASCRIIYRG